MDLLVHMMLSNARLMLTASVTPTGERKMFSDLFADIPSRDLDEAETL